MKTTSSPLLAHMRGNNQFTLADLYTLTLIGGTVLRYTDFDVDLVYGGNTFSASGPIFKRGKTRTVIGLEVDTLGVEIYPRSTDLVLGIPMLSAANTGGFDGATLKLERAYIAPVPTVIGALIMFVGDMADIDTTRTVIKVTVNSEVASLNVQMPRNLYQAACVHTLYDSDCALARASFVTANAAGAGSSTSYIINTLAQSAGYFDRGYMQWTSGALSGVKRTIKSYSPGSISIYNPLPANPGTGDTFNIYPGCDKALATCQGKFGNSAKFKGFPFIPVPETIL